MRKHVYSNSGLMNKVAHIKRYIDYGAFLFFLFFFFFTGSERQFASWLQTVKLALQIDESNFEDFGLCVPFLDILFCICINRPNPFSFPVFNCSPIT